MSTEFQRIIQEDKPTLVDFFATWCGPCRAQGPIVEQVKAHVGDEFNVLKVDVDQNEQVASDYNIRSVPTLIVFRNGKQVWRESGVHQADALIAALRAAAR